MKLQLTNEYTPRFDQISRVMQNLNFAGNSKVLSYQDLAQDLGVPDRQLESYFSLMKGFGLLEGRGNQLTQLGKIISQFDPYFEKTDTLWILHYQISSKPDLIVWNRIIHQVLPTQSQFSVSQVAQEYFSDLSLHFSNRTISKKLPGEIRAVFYAYTRSALARLGILEEKEKHLFVKSTPANIPELVFLYCLLNFREKFFPGSSAVNVEEISQKENSPGKVLFLSDQQCRSYLEALHDRGLIRLEQFANLDQVRFSDSLTSDFVLQRIYGG